MGWMLTTHPLSGVYAAAVTPLQPDYSLDLDALPNLLAFFARRGCHGALLFGTTGEGPSFSPGERSSLFRAAREFRQSHPDFRLLAGTGTPSLSETIQLTREAFDLGFDGVVVLPPYFFRKATDEGLFLWFRQVLEQAVPAGGYLLGYHIPGVSGVPLSLDLLSRLKDAFLDRFAGLKDSSGDPGHALSLGERFGADMLVMNGTDRLFSLALESGASGCITALANLCSPDLRRVWDYHLEGKLEPAAQNRLSAARDLSERYPPAAPLLKSLLALQHGFPEWMVRPPLLPLSPNEVTQAADEWNALGNA